MAYFVGIVFIIGISIFMVASFYDSPFPSPFSVNFTFRILPNKPLPTFISNQRVVRWRTIGILLVFPGLLVAGAYLVLRQNYFYFPCLFCAIACVFALMRGTDMQPSLLSLGQWVPLSSITVTVSFVLSAHFSSRSTLWCIFFFMLASIQLGLQGYIGVKMSEIRPMTIEAEAISWLLKMSSNKDPAWFQKAVQIAGRSPNTRALLVEKLLMLLLPLIVSLPKYGQGGVTTEQESYIETLAILMDFEMQRGAFCRNEASLTPPPILPEELIDRLEKLRTSDG
jgi:hypothetical protein